MFGEKIIKKKKKIVRVLPEVRQRLGIVRVSEYVIARLFLVVTKELMTASKRTVWRFSAIASTSGTLSNCTRTAETPVYI